MSYATGRREFNNSPSPRLRGNKRNDKQKSRLKTDLKVQMLSVY